jgi:anti-sigma B factor antagonist
LPFKVESLVAQDHAEIVLWGEVDVAATEPLLIAADPYLQSAVNAIVIDLEKVTFMDSSGLGALVNIRIAALNAGKAVVLRRPQDRVTKVLRITALDKVFTIER